MAYYGEEGRRLAHTDILQRVPELDGVAVVVHVPFRELRGRELAARDWLDLATVIRSVIESGVDGVVVAHGTNALEETAYFLSLALALGPPVIVVGSMRPASGLSSDADLNLVRAFQVAADPGARDLGVLVVMNDTIFAAREVAKSSTYRADAFSARDLGPLGFIDPNGDVTFYHHPLRREHGGLLDLAVTKDLPRVDIVLSYVGADGAMIEAAARAGARGIVSAGFGPGQCTVAEAAALDRAQESMGVVVCQSTRVGSGRVLRSPELVRRNVIAAGHLQPWKARILLAAALVTTSDQEAIQQLFDAQ